MAEERKTKEEENLAALSVEEMFQELNRLLASMEREDATLEESFASYEKGMKLVQLCRGEDRRRGEEGKAALRGRHAGRF